MNNIPLTTSYLNGKWRCGAYTVELCYYLSTVKINDTVIGGLEGLALLDQIHEIWITNEDYSIKDAIIEVLKNHLLC